MGLVEWVLTGIFTLFLVPVLALLVSFHRRYKTYKEDIHTCYKNYYHLPSTPLNTVMVPFDFSGAINASLKLSKWLTIIMPNDFSHRLRHVEDCISCDSKFSKRIKELGFKYLEDNSQDKRLRNEFKQHHNDSCRFFFNIYLLICSRSEQSEHLTKYKEDPDYYLKFYAAYSTVSYKSNK